MRADVAERAMIFSQRRERARRYGFFCFACRLRAAMLFTLLPPPLCRRQPPAPPFDFLLRFDIIFAR